ncbi:MAG: HYR domain-containing protein [Chitinophagaceae bacterium]|nr:HYR domain-containing protein [Chitinophagaceae bacterium]
MTAPFANIGTGQTQAVTSSGVYQLLVTNQYGCVSPASTTIVNVADYVFNGSLAAGDAQQTGRLNRFAVVSTCAAPKACPGTFTTTGSRYYDSYTITNPRSVPVCATIGLNSGCGTSVFSVAYTGSFNPTAPCTNYLADPGSSPATSIFYEATIPANGTIVVIVHEVNSGTGCANYSLTVDVPREAAGITANPGLTVCNGAPVTLTASTANTYLWSPDGQITQAINPTISGTYGVALGYGNNGCTNNTSVNLTVENPVVNTVPNQNVCNGSGLNIPFTGSGATSYTWTNTNPAIGLAASGSGNLNFTATNATGAPISGTITVTPVSGLCNGTPITFTITVANQPMITGVTNDDVCEPGGVVNLAATGSGTINWYDAATGGVAVNTGNTYSPNITSTTTYYLESFVPAGPSTVLGMPAQSNTFPGNVRGYWFTAPTDFVITSLSVPTTASSGAQSIAVVKFDGNTPPPVFSSTTNAFTTQFITRGNAVAGSIPCNIPVLAGEVIGILGYRDNINSYAPGDYNTTIAGFPVQLQRLGMQFPLTTTNPRDIFREFGPATSISRIEFEYSVAQNCSSAPRIPVTGTVNPLPVATATPSSQTVCSGPISTIILSSTISGTTFAWTRDNTVNVTGIPASGSGDISGILTNNTTVPQTVTFTITPTSADGCVGAPITATVTVNAVPTIVCPANITVNNAIGQCGSIVTYSPTITGIPVPTVTYTFSGATTASGSGDGSGSFFSVGTTTVTITATNSCGAVNCSFTVTVSDTENPVITCPAPVTVSCASAVPAVNIGSVTSSDNCPGVVVTHIGDVISNQTCANRYTITRTYRATDAANNFSECTQVITVNDQTPPAMTCPAPVTVSCASAVPAVNIAAVTGVSDNCGGTVTVTHVGDVISNQTCANRYTITRTYRATDVCGNFTECTQVITVNDQTPPAMTCPAPVTVSCASAVPVPNIAAVTGVSDNCGGTVTVTHVSDVISNQTCANRYTITRTYRATDVCGNFTQCTQIITVNDQTPPVITCPAPVTVSCASAVPAVNIASVTATDNCAGVVTITHVSDVITNQTCANRYTITRTYRATDVCGNAAECAQIITVNDQTAPVITCPSNITATTPIGSCTAIVNYTVTATDNCAGAVTIVSTPASGTAFPIGVTTVTSTATDACGNRSTCTFTVTVLDGQLPVISAQPANRTVCAGSNATFSVTASNVVSYQWQTWNGTAWVNITGANTASYTVANVASSMNTSSYRVILNGLCTVVTSNHATLYVNPLPNITLDAAPAATIWPNQTTTITATATPSGGSFAWTWNGSAVSGVSGSVLGPLSIDKIGDYRVSYTDLNGCVNSSALISITPAASDNNIWVYPNPNTGQFNVRYYNQNGEKATLRIYNATGQVVFEQALSLGIAYTNTPVNIFHVAAGVYIVKIVNSEGRALASRRIIVNH